MTTKKIDSYYFRACEREIAHYGFDPGAELPYIDNDDTRFRVWRASAMLICLKNIEAGTPTNLVTALRTWGLAREYHGRLGSSGSAAMVDTLDRIGLLLAEALGRGARALREVA